LTYRSPRINHSMIELKARVNSPIAIRVWLGKHGARKVGAFHQVDTYYQIPQGRLKLREVEGTPNAELIYYEREDVAGPKRSSVLILEIQDPNALKQILGRIVGIKVVVDKVREIFFYENIQVNLDQVSGLGSFVEFELVTSQNLKNQEQGSAKVEKLREQLGISPKDLQRYSYSDLI